MAARSISETKRVRYLLGLSSPAEREHIESQYFEDEDAFQEMLAAEDDLIDVYARGELAGAKRRRFEKFFVSSLRGRDRVHFARAFAGAVSTTRPETKFPGSLLDILKTFESQVLLRTARITAVIVFVAVLAWLVIDRWRMTNELSELHAESAELSKQAEALQRSSDTERRRTTEIVAQLSSLRAQPDKRRYPERGTTATQRARHLPDVKNDREEMVMFKAEQGQILIPRSDATIGNSFVNKQITELPLDASNVANLSTLQPATTGGFVAGGRADQANVTLDAVSAEPLNTYFLTPRNTTSSGETTIHIATSLTWIRFHIALETAAIHEDYRVTIKTADGRTVTSVNWSEPLTPNQITIDTPVVSTTVLPSGNYVLLLMGKEFDGSFVQVAECSFKVIKY